MRKAITYLLLSIALDGVVDAVNIQPVCSPSPGCPTEVVTNWWSLPPYIYIDKVDGGKIKGVLKDAVEMVIRECCGKCVTFKYVKNHADNFKMLSKTLGSHEAVLHLPVYGESTRELFKNFPYFSVIEPPGFGYFQKVKDKQLIAKAVMTSVVSGWPIFVVTMVMAALSGIVIWALDSYWNPQFPSRVLQGSWEGFWWAFVSMTTVGYGDKVPRSFIARVYLFFWVLFGLVLISIFIAAISTSLTSLCLSNKIDIFGKGIVAFSYTEEQRFASITNNAVVTDVTNITEFVREINKIEIDGGLLDSYVAGYYEKELESVTFAKVFEDIRFTYGFAITDRLDRVSIRKCLSRKLSAKENDIDKMVFNKTNVLSKPIGNGAMEKLFDGHSKIFRNSVYICLGASGFLLLCGVAWEYLYYKPRHNHEQRRLSQPLATIAKNKTFNKTTKYLAVYAAQCQEIEDLMETEIENFYTLFQRKIENACKLAPDMLQSVKSSID